MSGFFLCSNGAVILIIAIYVKIVINGDFEIG